MDITIEQIREAVEKAPVIQKRVVENGYRGLQVKWEVKFFGIDESPDSKGYIGLLTTDGGTGVSFEVKLSDYPELNILKNGHRILVEGTIADVDVIMIKLTDCQITILPEEKEPSNEEGNQIASRSEEHKGQNERSVIIFPHELINKLPDDIKKVCEEFNFSFGNRKPLASMLLLRRLLPLSIVRKFQVAGKELKIKPAGEYLETKTLLGKIEPSIKNKKLYREILNYKVLTDSSQHSYTFFPTLSDVEGAAIKIRLLLDDIFS
ncbi:hypothetical protein MYX76_02490 [Desulfobacterota bacterium AH_259_B03_O07]|nr:hypothetical protein [Desulfobacterota bacterium AH_259_B03_O07]